MQAQTAKMAARVSSIGFLGSGKMATAMARGFISAGENCDISLDTVVDVWIFRSVQDWSVLKISQRRRLRTALPICGE